MRLFSRRGWDESFPDVVTAGLLGVASSHADYAAAKAGDGKAAARLARDVVSDEFVADVRAALPPGSKPVVVPVVAREDAGNNKIPRAAAEVLAARLGLQVDDQLVQADKVGRGGGDAVYRLANQPGFDGAVQAGQDYLLIDDTLTQGGTLAQLKTHIEDAGGRVVLATALTGKAYSRKLALSPDTLARVRERFGSIENWWRGQFGYGFDGLTESEARAVLSLDNGRLSADGLRDRVAAAGVRGARPLDEGTAGAGSDAGTSGPTGRQSRGVTDAGGLSFDRALALKAELTKDWGETAPAVVVVRNAEGFPESAKVDADYRRAEGFYDGRPTVWLNASMITSERRFAEVLAHEAIGHYGIERIVGEKEWGGIVDAIGKLATTGKASDAMLDVLADVRRRYGDLDPSTYASEVLAVMAERGIRNSLISRVIAAVRRFLRRIMPSTSNWSENDVRALLAQAESFLRAGRNLEQRRRAVPAYAFSKDITVNARGERSMTLEGEKFVERSGRYYMVNGTGQPKDFDSYEDAWQAAQRTGAEVMRDEPIDGEPQTYSVVVPDGDVRAAKASRRFFSKRDDDVVPARTPQEVLDSIKLDKRPLSIAIQGGLTWLRERGLGLLPANYLTDFAPELIRSKVKEFMGIKRRMDSYRGEKHAATDEISQEWLKLAAKDKAGAAAFSTVAHESTLANVDPSLAESKPLQFIYGTDKDGNPKHWDATPENADKVKKAILKNARHDQAENKQRYYDQINEIDGKVAAEVKRPAAYQKLRAEYLKLSPELQTFYQRVRDFYRDATEEWDRIVLENIDKAEGLAMSRAEREYQATLDRLRDEGAQGEELETGKARAANRLDDQLNRLRKQRTERYQALKAQFESERLTGPYFPITRFGNFFVSIRDQTGKLISWSQFENAGERDWYVQQIKAKAPESKDWTIKTGAMKNTDEVKGAVDAGFMVDVESLLTDASVPAAVKDAIWQRYLQTLPDFSIRKGFIHRKGTHGFQKDALRAFGSRMFHMAHQIAKLKYGADLANTVDLMRDDIRNALAEDTTDADLMANEMERRVAWIMNPTSSNGAQKITSFAFLWNLAVSPAAAIVNWTQTPMIGIPVLGARLGGAGAAARELLKASAELMRADKLHLTRYIGTNSDKMPVWEHAASLSGAEKKAMEEFFLEACWIAPRAIQWRASESRASNTTPYAKNGWAERASCSTMSSESIVRRRRWQPTDWQGRGARLTKRLSVPRWI